MESGIWFNALRTNEVFHVFLIVVVSVSGELSRVSAELECALLPCFMGVSEQWVFTRGQGCSPPTPNTRDHTREQVKESLSGPELELLGPSSTRRGSQHRGVSSARARLLGPRALTRLVFHLEFYLLPQCSHAHILFLFMLFSPCSLHGSPSPSLSIIMAIIMIMLIAAIYRKQH